MKLNPPASSSDLDVARAIARRLNDRKRQGERSDEAPPTAVQEPPSPPPPEPAAFQPPDFAPPLPEPETSARAKPDPPTEPLPDLADPEVSEPQMPAPEAEAAVPEEAEPAAFAPAELEPPILEETPAPPPDESTSGPSTRDPVPEVEEPSPTDPWGPGPDDALSQLAGQAEASLEALEAPDAAFTEAPGDAVSPEDLLGAAVGPEPEPVPDSPFALEEPPVASAEPEGTPEALVATPGPSWDDVADACLALARAHGAMLVDPSGQVLTARGDWPEPGPDAIAGRLVSMMERTLQDAPTRSVSAPIAGQHLTAWRIPAGEGYLTVVFMGEAPLSADERPAIDDHIGEAVEGQRAG